MSKTVGQKEEFSGGLGSASLMLGHYDLEVSSNINDSIILENMLQKDTKWKSGLAVSLDSHPSCWRKILEGH